MATQDEPEPCATCDDAGYVIENGIEESWKVQCPRYCAAAVKWLAEPDPFAGEESQSQEDGK